MGFTFTSLLELEDIARARVPRPSFDYIAVGADDEASLHQNWEAYQKRALRPWVLVDVASETRRRRSWGSGSPWRSCNTCATNSSLRWLWPVGRISDRSESRPTRLTRLHLGLEEFEENLNRLTIAVEPRRQSSEGELFDDEFA